MPLKHTQEMNKSVKNKTTQAEKKGLTVSLAAMADWFQQQSASKSVVEFSKSEFDISLLICLPM